MALFDTIDELKKHNSALQANLELGNLQSFIDDAITQKLIPAIGFDQYNDFLAVKEGNAKQKFALQLAQKAVTGFTIYNYSDNGSVQINGAGILVPYSEKMRPASDKKLMQLRKSNIKAAFAALELLVSFLEDNKIDFPIYAVSEERKENRSLLINTSAEFQKAGVQIGNDAQLYQTLRVFQANAEETYIIPNLTESLAASLKAKMLSNSLTDIEKELLKKVHKALAPYTMIEAVPYLLLNIDSNGVFELSETVGGVSGNVENRNPATERAISRVLNGYCMKAEQHLETLRKFMKANAEALSYTVPTAVLYNDDPNSNIYVLL
ncbi:hypothetical protein OQZ33_04415 [Pedobacter sp. MC2016-05]|uniref:DUF6712 family protein n=1 Tax=Pedobacter sp. MC2016-05 TaxID=2994474 RepID=UPI002245C1B9|nr:DUF6712 family protein [Pedobacter sp. MC2016-05]MCX2473570.1 hypothetical protein [Pedobacter sp. MC2016-05]